MNMEKVKKDLKEIRCYYAHERDFIGAKNIIGESSAVAKKDRYNAAVGKASTQLYYVYLSLYVRDNSQAVTAEDMDCSLGHVKRLNRQLCEFFLNAFKEDNKE